MNYMFENSNNFIDCHNTQFMALDESENDDGFITVDLNNFTTQAINEYEATHNNILKQAYQKFIETNKKHWIVSENLFENKEIMFQTFLENYIIKFKEIEDIDPPDNKQFLFKLRHCVDDELQDDPEFCKNIMSNSINEQLKIQKENINFDSYPSKFGIQKSYELLHQIPGPEITDMDEIRYYASNQFYNALQDPNSEVAKDVFEFKKYYESQEEVPENTKYADYISRDLIYDHYIRSLHSILKNEPFKINITDPYSWLDTYFNIINIKYVNNVF